MTQHKKLLKKLIFASLFIAILYVAALLSTSTHAGKYFEKGSQRAINWNRINGFMLRKDDATFEVKKSENGSWVLPSKSNYPARPQAINAFFLKIEDIPDALPTKISESGREKLGLTQDSLKKGTGKVTLYYDSGEVAEELFLGALRKKRGETEESQLKLRGQYVRFGSSEQVFVVPTPIRLEMEKEEWIASELFSYSPKVIDKISISGVEDSTPGLVVNVKQTVVEDAKESESGEKTKEVVSKPREFVIEGEDMSQIEVPTLNQLVSAFEDVTFKDVFLREDAKVKDVKFDREVVVSFTDQTTLRLYLSKVDDTYYARVERSSTEEKEVIKKFNERMNPWTFELSSFLAGKFYKEIADYRVKESPSAAK